MADFVLDSLPPKIRDKGVKSKKYKQVVHPHNYDLISVPERAPVLGPGSEDLHQSTQQRPHGRHATVLGKERASRERARVVCSTDIGQTVKMQ